MSLTRSVLLGGVLGGVAAVGVYAAVAEPAPRTSTASPSFAPVVTPTVTVPADCEPPAALVDATCVTTLPGPTVVVGSPQRSTSAATIGNASASGATSVRADGERDYEHAEQDDDDGDDD